ncbi:hypothetical protein D3C81_443520 [compost metagenome]
MVVSTHGVFTGWLGAFAGSQNFELQAGSQGGDAVTLGVFSQEGQAFASGRFSLGCSFGLHDFTDHFEAGGHFFLADTAWQTGECVGQTCQDRVQVNARWRVVAQLVAQLTANAVADAGFVGGQIYFGHDTAPLCGRTRNLPCMHSASRSARNQKGQQTSTVATALMRGVSPVVEIAGRSAPSGFRQCRRARTSRHAPGCARG